MDGKLIRRMINLRYSNTDIINRLRCTEEAVNSIRELIRLEEEQKNKPIVKEEEWNWDNE
jgi:hypothetical protein